jgi:CheY-like chemotaxis protein/signal transduction histidine kinase
MSDPIDLSVADHITLDGKIDYLEDPEQLIDPSNLLEPKFQSQFVPLKVDNNSFGVTQSAWWFRIRVDFSAIPKQTRMLLIKNSLINDARLFHQNENKIELISKAGIAFPAEQRAIFDSLLIFPLTPQTNTTTYYLRLHNQGALQAPLEIWHPDQLMGQRNMDHWVMGIYFGLIFSMALYNFFIGYSTKDRAYFYYVGYLVSLSLVISLNDGYGQILLFPDSPYVAYMSINWASAILIIFASLFTQSFLNTSTNTPYIDRWLSINIGLSVLFLASDPLLDAFLKANLILLLILSFIASVLSAALLAYDKKVPAAKFFLAAWISMLAGSLLLAFAKMGVIPNFVISEYGLHIGTSIEAMLLSFALASKINRLEEKRATAVESARRSLEKSNQVLQDSHKIKDDFFSLLSHELRTPMHGVRGVIELFSTDNLHQEQKEKLKILRRSSDEMVSYIDNLLVLSQLKSNSLTLNELSFSPELLLLEIKRRFSHEAEDQKIEFRFNYPKLMVNKVIGDKRVLSVICSQLLNEAFQKPRLSSVSLDFDYQSFPIQRDFIPESSLADLTDAQLANRRRVQINVSIVTETVANDLSYGGNQDKDNPTYEPVSARIQTEFSRNSARVFGMTKELQHKLIKLLNGTLSEQKTSALTSRKELTIEMLIRLSEDQTLEQAAEKLESTNGDRLGLVVDDNSVNRVVAAKYLKHLGYRVETASDGKEAFEKTQLTDFDFVLMDCHMPVLNGFQATERIRKGENCPEIPIIAVTADVTKESADACKDSGMNAILHKPMSLTDLQRQLQQQGV